MIPRGYGWLASGLGAFLGVNGMLFEQQCSFLLCNCFLPPASVFHSCVACACHVPLLPLVLHVFWNWLRCVFVTNALLCTALLNTGKPGLRWHKSTLIGLRSSFVYPLSRWLYYCASCLWSISVIAGKDLRRWLSPRNKTNTKHRQKFGRNSKINTTPSPRTPINNNTQINMP